jgi:hypothetical protein
MSRGVKPRERDFFVFVVSLSLGADADRFEEIRGSPVHPAVNRRTPDLALIKCLSLEIA